MQYAGNKQRRAKDIVRLIPHDVEHYVEPFAGIFSVFRCLLSDRDHIKTAIVNDLDADLYRWTMSLRGDNAEHGDFIERLADARDRFLPEYDHADEIRAEFEASKSRWIDDGDPFAWFFLRLYAVGQFVSRKRANIASFEPIYLNRGLARWTIANAQKWRAALQFATVTNRDALDLLRELGSDHFAYIDPPYFPYFQKSWLYPCELTEDQHQELAGILRETDCRWLLSMGDNPPARELHCHPSFTCRQIRRNVTGHCKRSWSNGREMTEWLNRNYSFAA